MHISFPATNTSLLILPHSMFNIFLIFNSKLQVFNKYGVDNGLAANTSARMTDTIPMKYNIFILIIF
jgi:hypothetical protein